jgi:Domain of unknown function (DUF3597)
LYSEKLDDTGKGIFNATKDHVTSVKWGYAIWTQVHTPDSVEVADYSQKLAAALLTPVVRHCRRRLRR